MNQKYKPLTKEEYHSIKPGDIIERMLAFSIPMNLRVTSVIGNIITCGHWEFERDTGLEIDEDISARVSYISKIIEVI